MSTFLDIFEDVTKNGTKIPSNQYLPMGKYPIIDQGQNKVAGYTDQEEGLFTNVPAIIFGDHTRIIKYVDKPCFLGADGVKLLKAKDSKANYKYLYYVLSNAKIPDTGYNRHFKWLKEIDIPLYNEETQSNIVKELDKITALIEKRKKQLEKLDELVKARFVERFGDPVSNPKGWKNEKAENHIDLLSGFPFDSSRYVESGVNICGGLIIMPQRIEWNDCKHWCSTEGYEEYTLKENDIVIALDRPWISEGFKIAMVDAEHLPALLIQRTARIRATDINQRYLMYCFLLGGFDKHCNVTGSLVPHISAKDIRSFSIMLPPLELQEQFAAFVEQTDKSKLEVQKSLEKLELLKKALMQKYFG